METIPTLTDLFYNYWETEWDYGHEAILYNWYWGDHLVLQKQIRIGKPQKTMSLWLCPSCKSQIVLEHTSTHFLHCNGNPIDLRYPVSIFCEPCTFDQLSGHGDSMDYDFYMSFIVEALKDLPKIDPNNQDLIKQILDKIAEYSEMIQIIEQRNGWTHGGKIQ